MWPLEPHRHHNAFGDMPEPNQSQRLLVWPIQGALDNKEGGFDIQVGIKPLRDTPSYSCTVSIRSVLSGRSMGMTCSLRWTPASRVDV